MQELTELCQASDADRDLFDYYVKTLHRIDEYIQSLTLDAPDVIIDEINDAKVRLENKFIAFVKALQPEQR